MFLIRIIRFITGYVIFGGSGGFPERFINLCSQQGINIWDVRASGGFFTAKTTPKCYKKIRPCAKNSGMKIRIKKKVGLPFILRPYIKRKGLAAGAAVSLIFIMLLNSAVWTISVTGNEKYTDAQILALAESYGVYPGAFKKNIDLQYIRSDVKTKFDGISWFSVNINGSDVSLEVSESTGSNKIVDRETPCNIVSGTDGELLKIDAYSGKSEISPGSAVTKGDLLINGVLEKADGTPYFVHAKGSAVIRTKREISKRISLSLDEKEVSQIKKVRSVYLFGIKIPFGKKYDADIHREETALLSYKGKRLPVGIVTDSYIFHEQRKKSLSADSAKLLCCYSSFKEEMKIMENSETESKLPAFTEDGDSVNLVINYVNHETTGIEKFFEVE